MTESREIAEAASGLRTAMQLSLTTNEEGDAGWVIESSYLFGDRCDAEKINTHIAHFHPPRAIALLDVAEAAAELRRALDPDTRPLTGAVGPAKDALAAALDRLNTLDEADHE